MIVIETISSILYIIAGIIGTTKWSIRLKMKLGLEVICLIANLLWFIYSFANFSLYTWVGLLYIILGIIGVINFTRINIKEKKIKDNTVIREDMTDTKTTSHKNQKVFK